VLSGLSTINIDTKFVVKDNFSPIVVGQKEYIFFNLLARDKRRRRVVEPGSYQTYNLLAHFVNARDSVSRCMMPMFAFMQKTLAFDKHLCLI
jgi:hypothetical protein